MLEKIYQELSRIIASPPELVVDKLAGLVNNILEDTEPDMDPEIRRALAYAIVGDTVVSILPEPLDAPLDEVVQRRLQQLLPDAYRKIKLASSIAEDIPYVELLPNYTMAVLSVARLQRERSKYTQKTGTHL